MPYSPLGISKLMKREAKNWPAAQKDRRPFWLCFPVFTTARLGQSGGEEPRRSDDRKLRLMSSQRAHAPTPESQRTHVESDDATSRTAESENGARRRRLGPGRARRRRHLGSYLLANCDKLF